MRNRLIVGCAAAVVIAAGSASALIDTAKRAVPGASIRRHPIQHRVDHHVARQPIRRKPVVPPPQ